MGKLWKKYCKHHKSNGFSLLELVVVMVVLSVLATVVVGQLGDSGTNFSQKQQAISGIQMGREIIQRESTSKFLETDGSTDILTFAEFNTIWQNDYNSPINPWSHIPSGIVVDANAVCDTVVSACGQGAGTFVLNPCDNNTIRFTAYINLESGGECVGWFYDSENGEFWINANEDEINYY
jgi:prepilin-type N-terminal cleavage/methylation domain-containing protein